MACGGHRRSPRPPTPAPPPVLGEKGFMMIEYTGNDPETLYGEVTDTPYPFDQSAIRFVDIRDAVYFLGADFVEIV